MSEGRIEDLVGELVALGARLWEEDGRLRFRAPAGVLTAERKARLSAHKEAVLDLLRAPARPVAVAHPEQHHEPFPVTDVQAAYLLGRGSAFDYGGVGCHGYGELEIDGLDLDRLQKAWNALVARHDMLRAVIEPGGVQRVLPEVPDYRIEETVTDPAGFDAAVAKTRAELDHLVYDAERWPLFSLKVTRNGERSVLHFSIDFLICDFVSIQVLLRELHGRYAKPDEPLAELELTFRDYLLAEKPTRSGPAYEADRDYWMARIDELPPAPELPLRNDATRAAPRFRRHACTLDEREWAELRRRAGQYGVTPSGAVLAAYAEVIGRWSRRPAFTLDVTLLNRMPVHPQVDRLVGDFTSVNPLAVTADPLTAFHGRAKQVQATLWADLDHRLFSGVEVVREIARRRGGAAALMPVVFTSAIGLGDSAETATGFGMPSYGISQTPQVWIDCQNIEIGGGLATNWDVREGVFPDGVTEAMFAAYEKLLRALASGDEPWEQTAPVALPAEQRAVRDRVNATKAPVPEGLLHEGVLAQALRTPDAPLLIADDRTLTYAELTGRANAVAGLLRERGCRPGELVAVVAEKGWEQIAAVLGVLIAGGAYVPIDTNQPPARRDQILGAAGIRLVLTQEHLAAGAWPETCEVVALGSGLRPEPLTALPERLAAPGDLAYVIHTSGSTGVPKGVMISHRAALNTVRDIDARFGVGPSDRVLGLANLGFDLSVWDIFGPPAQGAALVLPSPQRRVDPTHWADLVSAHGVTLWNSVPAQLQMLNDYLQAVPSEALPSLRLAMLSGDWIPVPLPDQIRGRLPGLELVSLGGATEAAIWSISYPIGEVDPEWRSIPYGTPLLNQTFHVLDQGLRPRPDWVAGELYIGGIGVADGYLHDAERTAERFIVHPDTGERLYRTGDLGRYRPDGVLEFLGREDFQVKIRGHRIELAEIEAALQAHPAVAGCAVVAHGDRVLDRRLAGFAEPARRSAPQLPDLASAATSGQDLLESVDLPAYLDYLHELDQVALSVMLAAFQDAGVLIDPGVPHTLQEIYAALGVVSRHRRLVRRFLNALAHEGLVRQDGDTFHRAEGRGPLPPDQGWERAEALGKAAGQDDAELLGYFRTSGRLLPQLLRGEEDPLKLLFPDGRVEVSDSLYAGTLFNRWAALTAAGLARAVADTVPGPLRVLEVGAGAGGTTEAVLPALAGRTADYLYTDLSSYFLSEARKRFGDASGVRYAGYDLDADFRGQGLAPNSVDLVVAGDVLHATRDVAATLARLRELVAPGGWLVFVEMTRDHYQIMASLELLVRLDAELEDFADLRRGTDRTFLDTDRWRAELVSAGAEVAACVPLSEVGICVFAARFKGDRTPVTPQDLQAHLAERLPEHMVPPTLELVDALPRTGSGKLDRSVLDRWLTAVPDAPAGGEPPRTDLEERLAGLWADVLGVERVGRDQNFFDLRGDSLQAARLAGRLIEEVPEAAGVFFDDLLRQILERPTVAALADRLTDASASTPEAVETKDEAEALVPLGGMGESYFLLMHDATGGLFGRPRLLAALRERGEVWGVSGDALARHLDTAPHLLAERLVADAVPAVPTDRQVHVVGHGVGGVLALELARQLAEAGVAVAGLTVGDPLAGGSVDDVRAWYERESGEPAPGPADPDRSRLAGFQAVLAAAQEPPALYAGDVTLLLPAENAPGQPDPIAWWTEACLGEVRVHRVDLAADETENIAEALLASGEHA